MKLLLPAFLAAVLVFILISCSNASPKVVRVLEAEGCSAVVVTDSSVWSVLGCGKEHMFSSHFQCTKNGRVVTGFVCSGLISGYLVRYE